MRRKHRRSKKTDAREPAELQVPRHRNDVRRDDHRSGTHLCRRGLDNVSREAQEDTHERPDGYSDGSEG